MIEHMTHEAYVFSCRQRAVDLATGILDGTLNVLEACRDLAALHWEVEVDQWDEDFTRFSGISSETDALPVGRVRDLWSAAALARIEPDIQSAVEWATPLAIPACRSVIARFHRPADSFPE